MVSKITQLDLFAQEKELQIELEKKEFEKVVTKSIRALFARFNEIEFAVLAMHKRLDNMGEAMIKNG